MPCYLRDTVPFGKLAGILKEQLKLVLINGGSHHEEISSRNCRGLVACWTRLGGGEACKKGGNDGHAAHRHRRHWRRNHRDCHPDEEGHVRVGPGEKQGTP